MAFIRLAAVLYLLFMAAVIGVGIYLLVLVIKALRKYIHSKEVREEKKVIKRTLGRSSKRSGCAAK